jgi:hypothetical protein
VSLAQRIVSSRAGFLAPYKIFSGKNGAKMREPQKKNHPLGQTHSPAIEPGLKTTPLVGLFRPTGRRLPDFSF